LTITVSIKSGVSASPCVRHDRRRKHPPNFFLKLSKKWSKPPCRTPLIFSGKDLVAALNALVADIDSRPRDKLLYVVLAFGTERTSQNILIFCQGSFSRLKVILHLPPFKITDFILIRQE
jgi:hypothetical protein